MSAAQTERPAILVVDDDPDLRDLVCIVLEAAGYAPVAATDGADALRLLDRAGGLAPAAITLDLRMPVMDGWAFLDAYARTRAPRAPVLVLTAVAGNGYTLAADVAGVLTKPFDLDELVARIGALAPLPAEAPGAHGT